MNEQEKAMYADFIMGMRERAKYEYGDNMIVVNDSAPYHFYGEKYYVIRDDFKQRVKRNL